MAKKKKYKPRPFTILDVMKSKSAAGDENARKFLNMVNNKVEDKKLMEKKEERSDA